MESDRSSNAEWFYSPARFAQMRGLRQARFALRSFRLSLFNARGTRLRILPCFQRKKTRQNTTDQFRMFQSLHEASRLKKVSMPQDEGGGMLGMSSRKAKRISRKSSSKENRSRMDSPDLEGETWQDCRSQKHRLLGFKPRNAG